MVRSSTRRLVTNISDALVLTAERIHGKEL